MDDTIGEAVGQIWQYLDTHGAQSLPQLQQGTQLSERLVHMGVGWLAREGKLVFRQERGVLKLSVQAHGTTDEQPARGNYYRRRA